MRYVTLLVISLLASNAMAFANTNDADTLIVKTGECKATGINVEGIDALNWNTGNQDVALPEAVFASVKICGIGEGVTYISGSSMNGEKQFKIIVKVVPDHTKEKITKPVLPEFQSSINSDVDEILKKIVADQTDGEFKSRLKVSENKRFLVEEVTGKPFLFISQTLWSMTRRLSREEILMVLDICKDQGFTAVQLLAHSHYMGPNGYGNFPFENENFLRPALSIGSGLNVPGEYDWWDHLEFIIQECIKREMYVCLLPTWREQWNQKKNLHKNNSYAYGKFIGQRYLPYNPWIIWVMGGDEAPNTPEKMAIHRELANGIANGISGKEDYTKVMMTYHTHGPTSTSDFFLEDEPFMDFNTIQSGHGLENLEGMIEKAYQSQQKPVMDFEPFYTKNGLNTNEARTIIYWGVFSGGFGTSYGSWNLWHCGDRNDLAPFSIPEAFYEGFGTQIGFLGKLLSSFSMVDRVPNQKLLMNNQTSGLDRILACTATDKSFAMVYSPNGEPFTVDLSLVGGKKIHWQWFKPSNGEIHNSGDFRRKSNQHLFTPPTRGDRFTGNDWALVIN